MKFNKEKCEVLHGGGISPCSFTCWGLTGWKAAWQRDHFSVPLGRPFFSLSPEAWKTCENVQAECFWKLAKTKLWWVTFVFYHSAEQYCTIWIVHVHEMKKNFPHLHFTMISFSSGGVSTCLKVGRGTIIFLMQMLNMVSSGLELRSCWIKDGLVYSGLQYSNSTSKISIIKLIASSIA